MKNSLTIFLIITLCLAMITLASSKKIKKSNHHNHLRSESSATPQAADLNNHYGDNSFASKYGPQANQWAQYVEANPDTFIPFNTNGKKEIQNQLKFKPYPGYENKLRPHDIKSGDMTNIAPSASRIIKPEIADPKLNIQAELIYPTEVHLPTFKGMKKEFHPVTAYDKETGEIIQDKVLINKPEYVLDKQVMNIKHPYMETINLKTGERVEKKDEKVLHGSEVKL